jgi:hypothetical protein
MDGKNKIVGPMEPVIPSVAINGVPILIVADLPEGGFLQIVSGANPMLPPTPSVQMAKGSMLAIVPANVAEHLRPGLQELDRRLALQKGLIGNGEASAVIPLNPIQEPRR